MNSNAEAQGINSKFMITVEARKIKKKPPDDSSHDPFVEFDVCEKNGS